MEEKERTIISDKNAGQKVNIIAEKIVGLIAAKKITAAEAQVIITKGMIPADELIATGDITTEEAVVITNGDITTDILSEAITNHMEAEKTAKILIKESSEEDTNSESSEEDTNSESSEEDTNSESSEEDSNVSTEVIGNNEQGSEDDL